ncbi:MAG: sulfate adenylyltransferase subunit CysN [Acidobacteria bacterium]|nr:sulfate adenylyltransferase subunit CysN [Acidobacteriota bacterium]
MPAVEAGFTIEEFLKRAEERDLLRFSTAGSVDDGKSTLIGRLLYETKGAFEDQIASIKNSKYSRAASGPFDFALLTDGLKAEREQGITIDVAYRFFQTATRKFIIADTPGHEQYTRNMATGASTADLAIILIDARLGVLPQSRRHATISALLGIPHIVVAVNKMDLREWSEEAFRAIEAEFRPFLASLGITAPHFIPISALYGDNIVTRGEQSGWYTGKTLLETLESVPVGRDRTADPFRLPVQIVLRPNQDFRGFAGQIASGTIRRGDPVMVLPSGRTSRVKSIVTYDGNLDEAFAPMSVTIELEDHVDVSRGEMLVGAAAPPHVARTVEARLVWMDEEPLEEGKEYLIKHTTQMARARVVRIAGRLDVVAGRESAAVSLRLNDIGTVVLEANRPLLFDAYRRNRSTGSFVLIDPIRNGTSGAGMIEEPRQTARQRDRTALRDHHVSPVTQAERFVRNGHVPATVVVQGKPDLAMRLERALFELGALVFVRAEPSGDLLAAGALVILCPRQAGAFCVDVPGVKSVEIDPAVLPADPDEAVEAMIARLEHDGVLLKHVSFEPGEGI